MVGTNDIKVTGNIPTKGEFVIGSVTITGPTTTATGISDEGMTDYIADADTLTFTNGNGTTTVMGADDTIVVSVTAGASTFITAAVPFTTDFATTLTAVAVAVAGLNGGNSFTAVAAGGVVTVTDKTLGTEINASSITFTNAADNVVTSTVATTTDNVTVTAAADKLFGGAGNDTLVNNAGLSELTGGAGNDLFVISMAGINVNSYNTIKDFAAGDLLQFTGAVAFKPATVALGGTAVFQDKANAAINALLGNEVGWFQDGTDTYVVMDKGNSTAFINGTDMIVKITGLVDLSQASFNDTSDTIGLI